MKQTAQNIRNVLQQVASEKQKTQTEKFFKRGKGEYAEKDLFLGIKVPALRQSAKQFHTLPFSELKILLDSLFNEERLLALFILVNRYQRGNLEEKEEVYQFYLGNLNVVNNWNLVDSSSPYILGNHLVNKEKDLLLELAKSSNLWERRIAILATFHFIKNNAFEETLKVAQILLQDPHDLIHKAVGWMLREIGKRDLKILEQFLDNYSTKMPRTMLRYTIEKLPDQQRVFYIRKKEKA